MHIILYIYTEKHLYNDLIPRNRGWSKIAAKGCQNVENWNQGHKKVDTAETRDQFLIVKRLFAISQAYHLRNNNNLEILPDFASCPTSVKYSQNIHFNLNLSKSSVNFPETVM
jgi:hypothetical protein